MYILVKINDEFKVSEAISILRQNGFDQVRTGEEMRDICSECQIRADDHESMASCSFTPLISTSSASEMPPMIFKKEEDEGVPAETLFTVKDEDVEDEEAHLTEQSTTSADYVIPEATSTFFEEVELSLGNIPSSGKRGRRGRRDKKRVRKVEDDEEYVPPSCSHDDELRLGLIKRKKLKTNCSEDNADFFEMNKITGEEKIGMIHRHLMRLQRRNKDGTSLYYCFLRNRVNNPCPGAFKIDVETGLLDQVALHNHEPNDEQNKIEFIKFKQKELAKENPHLEVTEIMYRGMEGIGDYEDQDWSALGNYDSQRRRIQRAKRKGVDKKETTEQYWTKQMIQKQQNTPLTLHDFL